jgi:16S rRNA (cytidine1402-2'-O)-methyltransferase
MLYIVSTPIGNLEDITLRAIRILKEVDLIASEDTRRTKGLLNHYNIKTPLISYYSYKETVQSERILKLLKEGKNIALVSDAGTPGISDAGYKIIKLAIDDNIGITHIPGPTSLITSVILSGFPTHEFTFVGFLSNKINKRKNELKLLKNEQRTLVLFESCHRLIAALKDILENIGDRRIVVVREATKLYEEVKRGKTSEVLEYFSKKKLLGEFTVVIESNNSKGVPLG